MVTSYTDRQKEIIEWWQEFLDAGILEYENLHDSAAINYAENFGIFPHYDAKYFIEHLDLDGEGKNQLTEEIRQMIFLGYELCDLIFDCIDGWWRADRIAYGLFSNDQNLHGEVTKVLYSRIDPHFYALEPAWSLSKIAPKNENFRFWIENFFKNEEDETRVDKVNLDAFVLALVIRESFGSGGFLDDLRQEDGFIDEYEELVSKWFKSKLRYECTLQLFVEIFCDHEILRPIAKAFDFKASVDDLNLLTKHEDSRVRIVLAKNLSLGVDTLRTLALDEDIFVRTAAFNNPKATDEIRASAALLGVNREDDGADNE